MAFCSSRKHLRLVPLAATTAVLMFSSVLQALNVSPGGGHGPGAPATTPNDGSSSSIPAGAGPGGACPAGATPAGSERNQRDGGGTGGARTAHLVVLVHGWMGNPLELAYLRQAMTTAAAQGGGKAGDGNAALVVRSSHANDGRTSDGIKAGGERLAAEVSTWIDELLTKTNSSPGEGEGGIEKVSLSFVGNSLGGLYARYAVGVPALLDLDRVEPRLFCTTATPHLGVAGHTYVALPTLLEGWVAAAIGATGRDLFRRNDTLEKLTVDAPFVDGLRRFRKRVAYANAHYTDFQVPSATAAFVTPDLDSPHVRLAPSSSSSMPPDFVAISVETPPNRATDVEPSVAGIMSAREMARRLDGLGWTKVFVDLRPHLASVPLPLARAPNSDPDDRDRSEYTSSELHERYCRVTNRLHFPLGHTVLVANSKNALYRRLNAAGKPVVDRVAADLLREIVE